MNSGLSPSSCVEALAGYDLEENSFGLKA